MHGAETVQAVEAASRILFGGANEVPSAVTIALLAREMPVTTLSRGELDGSTGLIDLLVRTGLAESKGAARKLMEGGGVYLNNQRESKPRPVSTQDMEWPGAMLLRTGKKNYHLVIVEY